MEPISMDIEEGSMDGESKYAVHSAAEIRELALAFGLELFSEVG